MNIKRVLLTVLLVAFSTFAVIFFYGLRRQLRDERNWKLARAAFAGDLTTVQRCVNEGAVINTIPTLHGGAANGSPALQNAASEGHEDIVRFLLDHGADPNFGVVDTPLAYACFRRHYPVAKLLLERGAKPNGRGESSESTPLILAKGQPELLALLREYGARDNPSGAN